MKEYIRIVAYNGKMIHDIYEHSLTFRKNGDIGGATQNAVKAAIEHARAGRRVELRTHEEEHIRRVSGSS